MWLKYKLGWITAGIVVLLALIWSTRVAHPGPRLRLGQQTVNILDNATRVETFRVVSPVELASRQQKREGIISYPKAPQVDGCYVMATGKEQNVSFARRITHILYDETTYSQESTACIMFPGVVFRVCRGSQWVDVVLCFHCGQMYTVTHDAEGRNISGVYTQMGGSSGAEFVRLAKEAFPNDKDLQAL